MKAPLQQAILERLRSGSKTAGQLGGTRNIYRALKRLKAKGLIESRRMDHPARVWISVTPSSP